MMRVTMLRCLTLLIGLMSLAPALPAQGRSLTLDDYYRLEQVSSPVISPDGRWIAYLRGIVAESENRRRTELWLGLVDGAMAPRRISDSATSASEPRFSPDSRILSYTSTSRRPDGSESGVLLVDLSQPTAAPTRLPGLSDAPVWSPDGKWIAFTRPTPPDRPAPPALTDSERKLRERFTGRVSEWMNYRFDGRGYLPDPRDPSASPPRELYLLPAVGGTPRRITTLGVDVRQISWRPDSRALAFVADLHQRDEHTYERADLFTITMEGQLTRLTDDGHDHSFPAWSPDGRWLVFTRQLGLSSVIAAGQNQGAPEDVYRVPAGGGHLLNLTPAWDLLPGQPRVTPDGKHVYFSGGVGGGNHLFRVAITGGEVEQVTRGARRLGSFSWTTAGDRMAYAGGDAAHPAEVFHSRPDGSDEKRLTRHNDALLAELPPRPVERIQFTSRDGTPIEGWVMTPRGYDRSRPGYPVLLAIHGGPHGAYGEDYSFQFQYWADNGYIVVYSNPRGSTGYGEKFLWGTWGGWGNKDGEDVMAAVDHVLANYAADSTRLGVTGYSYGGFLTNWLITQTTRFKAAVVGAGISNWLSDYGTADIPRTKESEFYGPPWDARGAETLWSQSPVRLASRVKTPALFVHGEADLRVPIEQAEQMYVALQKNKVPSRFVRYPGMYHGGWSPWNTVHRYSEELAWWNRWLAAAQP